VPGGPLAWISDIQHERGIPSRHLSIQPAKSRYRKLQAFRRSGRVR
jgi:hypothetical protein